MSELEFTSDRSSNVSADKRSQTKLTSTGVALIALSGAFTLGFSAAVTPFLTPALRKVCLPFVPATKTQLENVRNVLKKREKKGFCVGPSVGKGSFLDIGSGDGRIVLEAAKQGFQATGVEINFLLVFYSRYKAYRLGLHRQSRFLKQDLWKTDLSKYDNIVVFGVEQMMQPLKEKLSREMSPDVWVVACRFPFPDWNPAFTIGTGIDTTWVYTSPPDIATGEKFEKVLQR